MWIWSSPCRIATQRTASSSSPNGRQPGAVHHLAGDLRPLIVAERLVLGRGAHRAVPHRPGEPPRAHRGVRLVQQAGQPPEIPPAVLAQRRLQLSRVPPARDDMGVGVLLPPPGTVQVMDERLDTLPARRADLPDHAHAFRNPAAVPSGLPEWIPRAARRAFRQSGSIPGRRNVFRLSPESLPDFFRDRIEAFRPADALRRVRKKITRTLPGRIELRYRLVKVHADSAYQPGRAHKLPEQFMEQRCPAPLTCPARPSVRLGRVGAPGPPGSAGRRFQQRVLLVGQREPTRRLRLACCRGPP